MMITIPTLALSRSGYGYNLSSQFGAPPCKILIGTNVRKKGWKKKMEESIISQKNADLSEPFGDTLHYKYLHRK